MPKEFVRKRGGKRNAKKEDSGQELKQEVDTGPSEPSNANGFFIDTAGEGTGPEAGPSQAGPPAGDSNEIDPAAPFGYVDPDIKAYLRSVDERLREWENLTLASGEEGESELEDRTNFLHSSLSEVRGLELKLATDSDCALIVERLLHSMGDWGRRVVADAFSANWSTLLQHRFGSHVCQTLFSLAAETIDRESRQLYPRQHLEQATALAIDSSLGVLRTMTELITAMTEEILPALPTLLISTFASPPIRLLLILLSPGRPIPSTSSSASGGDARIRSKKSQKYRSREAGGMKSILDGKEIADTGDTGRKGSSRDRVVPESLASLRKRICAVLTKRLGGNEWRSMGVSSAGGPAVQILLELEAEDGNCEKAGSILDHLTSGLVTDTSTEPAAQDYIPSLLRDAQGSHLLQAMLKYSPEAQFEKIWKVYFVGRIGKLGGHPTGNFVVSTGIERLDEAGMRVAVTEIHSFGASSLIRTSRTAALKSLVDRAASQNLVEKEVIDLVCESFELGEDRASLVQCAMTLNIAKSYQNAVKAARGEDVPEEEAGEQEEEQHGWKPRGPKRARGSLEPSIQGAVLLQSMLLLHEPAVKVVLDSLMGMGTDELLALAQNPISSHVLDAVLTSPTVPAKYRRKLILGFIGHYFTLADDCFGSRVADTIWARSDGYLKEKVARSLLPKAIQLGNSRYGKFFSRKLNLHLLERRPDEWREMQLGVVHHFNGPKLATSHIKAVAATPATIAHTVNAVVDAPLVETEAEGKKRKRVKVETEGDVADPETAAIDEVFAGVVSDKPKKKKKKVKVAE